MTLCGLRTSIGLELYTIDYSAIDSSTFLLEHELLIGSLIDVQFRL